MTADDTTSLQTTKIHPFPDASSARDAVRSFSRPRTDIEEIRAAHQRLLASTPDIQQNVAKILLENFENLVLEAQRVIFELTEHIFKQSSEISRLILPLAALVGSRDEQVQTRAVNLICSVGPLAKPAEDLAMGCLRNNDPAIRLFGARILFAIGPSCSRSIIRQLRAVAQRFAAEREFCALLLATVRKLTDQPLPGAPGDNDVTRGTTALPAITCTETAVGESTRMNLTDVLVKFLQGRMLLVIDDNEDLRHSIAEMLGDKLGMKILQADSGQRGLAMIQGCAQKGLTLDFIVLDLKMPDINGIQVLTKIRENPATADLPVIVMTAVIDERIIETVNNLGASEYIRKPFRMNQLIRSLVAAHRTNTAT